MIVSEKYSSLLRKSHEMQRKKFNSLGPLFFCTLHVVKNFDCFIVELVLYQHF